jgi:serine/threonine-protein kinase
MGVVVAATHLQLEDKFAIKFLLPEAAKSADVVSRFEREARAAVKIKSEHVARVHDVGKLDNGSPFMVMEFLNGRDLADTVERQGALPWAAAVEYVLQACEALAEAHAAGIVHRDLKPANLFLIQRADGSPCIKVLDFGISKMVGSASMPGMTKTSAVMGSPLYMSPEQLKSSKDVDHRTDIWSLGSILYELLSGNPPFIADTMPQLCLMILQEPPAPLSQIRHDVPPQLEAVIRKCQEKDPNHRFQNVAELSAALAQFVTGRARLSAERIADVFRTSANRGSSLPGSAPQAPPAGAPGYGAPAPTVPGAPYGSSSQPNFQAGAPYGNTGGNYPAQAQTGGTFSQSNPAHSPAVAATVMGTPGMMATTGPGGTLPGATMNQQHGPPMAASTASSWEGAMGAPKKKGSAGLIIGVVAGLALVAGIGIAAVVLGGGSKDNGNANAANALPQQPTSTVEVKPTSVAPAVTPTPEPPATRTIAASPEPPPANVGGKPGKTVKPGPTATTTTTTAPVALTIALPPAVTVTAPPKGQHPGLDDDRK